MSDELAWLDATAQAELVRSREIPPIELVDAAIARIEKLNPQLNAVISSRFDAARAEASSANLPDGPFRGVPLLLKDLIAHSAGDPFHEGMRLLKEIGWREERDSFLAARFRAAGLVLLGKTNTPELGILPTTEPEAYGPTRNPWDPRRSPGGSSGGSGAAVASGMVPVAHANDLGGSIRIPASACGLVGLKPSRARNSLGDEFGEMISGMVCEHVVTRTVRDSAGMLDAISGSMLGDPYCAPAPARAFSREVGEDPGRLRVGFMDARPFGDAPMHPDCVQAARDAARALEEAGHSVEEAHPPALDEPDLFGTITIMFASYAGYSVDFWQRRLGRAIGAEDVEPATWGVTEIARSFSAMQYLSAVEWMHAWSRRMAAWWQDFDLLVTPTLAEPPVPLGTLVSPPGEPLLAPVRAGEYAPFTLVFNMTGQPAISLPLSWSREGLPIGAQLVAAYGREDLLIRVASQLEAARPWAERHPPVSA